MDNTEKEVRTVYADLSKLLKEFQRLNGQILNIELHIRPNPSIFASRRDEYDSLIAQRNKKASELKALLIEFERLVQTNASLNATYRYEITKFRQALEGI